VKPAYLGKLTKGRRYLPVIIGTLSQNETIDSEVPSLGAATARWAASSCPVRKGFSTKRRLSTTALENITLLNVWDLSKSLNARALLVNHNRLMGIVRGEIRKKSF
jgi:hypothetical protein